ncbi:YjbH domain-containing protein [Gammaproteobacteria bacterium]|nr:YjbH domain-containing protein [Gammaproteobacteria bacterium]
MYKLGLLFLALVPSFAYSTYYVKNSYTEINATYNSIGQTGLIHLPTGSLQKEGTLGLTMGNSSLNRFVSVVATPFPWFEGSFFFNRPRDTLLYGLKKDKYLDKGFNLKFGFDYQGIDIALGIDDIGGTGFLAKEYFVATTNINNINFTLGFGTGKFAEDNSYKNPIAGLRKRPKTTINRTGELDYNVFFKGPIGVFGGIEFNFLRIPGLAFKVESNPFNYSGDKGFLAGGVETQKSISNRRKDKDLNYGIYYQFKNDFTVSISKIKGNSFDLMLSKNFNFNGPKKPVQPKKVMLVSQSKNKKLAFYQNILRNLEKDDLFLQSAELKNMDLKLGIVNNKYNDPIKVFDHTKRVISSIAKSQKIPISNLTITNINSGMETASMTAKAVNRLNPDKIGYVNIDEPLNDTKEYDFQTILSFPEFYNSIEPEFIYRYADPTRFFAGGIDIQLNSEIKFLSNFYLNTAISYQLSNSFKRLRYFPDSPYLPHVRTDVVKYLNNSPDLYLNSLQLDKLRKISNGHYLKFSAGMYEMMFGGYGIEYLWKPFALNLSLGLSLYQVKQRDFEQRLGFRDYEVDTGHANFIYFHPYTGLSVDLSVGKYLAGDKGYTFDVSRRFKSGFKMGAYFTRTNISKIEYGEGSFDKGFYFEMPFSFLRSDAEKGVTKITIQPLTRDGGAKLKTNNPLIYSIISGTEGDYKFFLE